MVGAPSSVPLWVWVTSATYAAGGVYLWWRLVVGTTRPGTTSRRIGTAALAIVTLSAPVALLSQFLTPIGFQRVVGWPAWIGYAFIVFAGCTALLTEPFRVLRWGLRRRAAHRIGRSGSGTQVSAAPSSDSSVPTEGPASPLVGVSRRNAIARGLAGGIFAVGITATGAGIAGALGSPRVLHRTIAIRSLPDEAVGTRIALVSDLHVGSLTRRGDCQRIVDLVNAQNPDIICLAGDFSDGSATELGPDLAPLADLRATEGTFFVTGNHEFYFDVDSWLQFLPTVGVRVLANESVQIRGMVLAGVHDPQGEPAGRGPDLDRALSARTGGQPAIVISHDPAILDDVVAADVDLLLSGHTHGGQFYPGVWLVGATTRTLSGYYAFGDTQVFVTNGCRFWGPVARLGAPMDITILELTRA